jgi:hypothetical protein
MNKNGEKAEKSSHTIEITIPSNGVISEANKGSSKEEQMSNEFTESNSSDDTTSKKGQMSNKSETSNSSDDATSKKLIINIK